MKMHLPAPFLVAVFFCSAGSFARGEDKPLVERFPIREGIPVAADLIVRGSDMSVTGRESGEGGDSISAAIRDDRSTGGSGTGLYVRISSREGAVLWERNMGYNMSALPKGCSAAVTCHPKLPLILVKYRGYKWDRSNVLLFVETTSKGSTIREYSGADRDFEKPLRDTTGMGTAKGYLIMPEDFVRDGVRFTCAPIAPEGSPHPFRQDLPWPEVITKVGPGFKVTVAEVAMPASGDP